MRQHTFIIAHALTEHGWNRLNRNVLAEFHGRFRPVSYNGVYLTYSYDCDEALLTMLECYARGFTDGFGEGYRDGASPH
jgi:hypothetical protein